MQQQGRENHPHTGLKRADFFKYSTVFELFEIAIYNEWTSI